MRHNPLQFSNLFANHDFRIVNNSLMRNEKIGSKLNLALGNLNALPAMPVIAQKLLALPLNTEAGEAQMLHLIEQDPQLSARLLGLANAPVLGIARKINSIQDAAMLLGLKRMKSVAIGIATLSELSNQATLKSFDPHDLWTHSMTIAIVVNALARAMPQHKQPDENLIFLAGLLHDIGLMALHHLDPEASDELHHQLQLQPRRPIHEIELELLGVTHGYIGAQLARHWNLPNEIIEVVELHHSSSRISDLVLTNPLARLVNLAEKLLPNFGISEHTIEAIDDSDWYELGIAPAQIHELSAQINELAIQAAQLSNTRDASERRMERTTPAAPETNQSAGTAKPSILFDPLRVMMRWISKLLR